MKNLLAIAFNFIMVMGYSQVVVPTKKTPSPYKMHGVAVADDYSWLENIKSDETTKWVAAENEITNTHLKEVKKKYNFEKKIKEYDLLDTDRLPQKIGKYYYSRYVLKDHKAPLLYYRKKLEDEPIYLLDPNTEFKGKEVFLKGVHPSKNSSVLAYQVNFDGSDKSEIRFLDIHKKTNIDDVISGVKFSGASWNLDYGVFYKKNNNAQMTAIDSTNQLYYHKLGTKQSEDKLVFDASKTGSYITFYTTRGKLIVIETSKDETTTNYYQASLSDPDFTLSKFIDCEKKGIEFLDYRDGQIYFSSKEYDWGEIRSFNINNREEETVIVPQIYNQLLVSSTFTDDYIFCRYKTIGRNYIRVYDPKGNFIRKFDTPEGFEFRIRMYDEESKNLYVTMHSYARPALNYTLNVVTDEILQYYNRYIEAKPTIFPIDYFETKNITYKSRDNKDVPITIVHKRGMKLDGNNPTLLRAYGGFGVVSSPGFSSGLLCFLENGGVFAYAEIRGGGEKGLNWEKDGKNLKKMNSFNDFIDAAEYLIKEKYTSPSRLAINGGSYGGLVVGVAMTKRPELFKVAIPEMGALDMVKFDKYTIGRYHLDEFGNPENKAEFDNLLSYSPYHNIDEKTNYPITLIITSENDDRVPPLHSYKFAARLQNREAQKNPIYLQTLGNSGHYGKVSTYNDMIKSDAEFYDFLLYHLKD
ncbi:prolyl oligopeptidase family serine peptidase [Flavobacterium sp.]